MLSVAVQNLLISGHVSKIESNQKQEHKDRNKEQNPAMLRYSHPYLWQRVLDNITKHGKKVGSHRNEERRGRTERKLMNRIRARQMSFLGHIMRKHGLENIVVTGKIEGERSRGRPRLKFMKSLSQLLKISEVEIIERTRNREEWRTMTANVRIGYGGDCSLVRRFCSPKVR